MPKGPNMDAVRGAFDTPTADFTDGVAAAVARNAFESLGISSDLGAGCEDGQECSGPEFLVAALGGLVAGAGGGEDADGQGDPQQAPRSTETQTQALKVGGVDVDAEGFAEITRICPGLAGVAGQAADALINGDIQLTSTFDGTGIDPVVWGTAAECVLGIDGVPQKIDAALNLFVTAFEERGGFEDFAKKRILFDIRGTRAVGDAAAAALNLAFRVNGTAFEVLVPHGDEHLILVKRGEEIAFRAANGIFQCANLGEGFLSGACNDAASGEVQW